MLIEIKRFQPIFVAYVLFPYWFLLDFITSLRYFYYYHFIPFLIILQLIMGYLLKTYVIIILPYGAVGNKPNCDSLFIT